MSKRGKDKEPRLRRTKTEIAAGISAEQAIEVRKQKQEQKEAEVEKVEKPKRGRPRKEKIKDEIGLSDVKQKRGLRRTLKKSLKTRKKKPRFRRTKTEIAAGMSIKQATEARKQKREPKKQSKFKPKIDQYQVKPEPHCGVKIIASVVKVGDESRVKISRNYPSELAPCEELVFKITFEKDGIPVRSIFDQVRKFATAIAHCMDTELSSE